MNQSYVNVMVTICGLATEHEGEAQVDSGFHIKSVYINTTCDSLLFSSVQCFRTVCYIIAVSTDQFPRSHYKHLPFSLCLCLFLNIHFISH